MKAVAIGILVFLSIGNLLDRSPGEVDTWTNPKDSMEYVFIPDGSIFVQIEDGQTPNSDLPFQEVFVDRFWMSTTEVTVAQFRRFVEDTGYLTDAEVSENKWNWRDPGFLQRENHPVVYVSFEDAKAYVNWAGVDLPDEAEWLYACCANTTTRYYWGDEMNPDLFWHRENSMEGTHPVAENLPNPWGLYDMVGNVKEYCNTIGGGFALAGESWTRCISYRNRSGMIADQLIANSIMMLLHIHSLNPEYLPYPWDDDRGFRCVMRRKDSLMDKEP
jgi:formylglycine-generating enzyme required for sulfatase activity